MLGFRPSDLRHRRNGDRRHPQPTKNMNKIKNNWGKILLTGTAALALVSSSRATDASNFDYTTFSGALVGGLVVVGSVAAGIAAIKGGVMVWKKIAKYFNQAG
jgi:hypothetical protein